MESSVFLCAKSSSAPGRHFLGSEEGTARLRGAIGSAPGKKKRIIRFYFSLAERISPDSKIKPKNKKKEPLENKTG